MKKYILISAIFFTIMGVFELLRNNPDGWAVRWVIAAVLFILLSALSRRGNRHKKSMLNGCSWKGKHDVRQG